MLEQADSLCAGGEGYEHIQIPLKLASPALRMRGRGVTISENTRNVNNLASKNGLPAFQKKENENAFCQVVCNWKKKIV